MSDGGEAEDPDYFGHRERLRERFNTAGPEALADYELLEILLFRVHKRKNTKPVAKALIAKFGSFSEALSAPPERLREVEGVGEVTIADFKVIQAVALRLMKGNVAKREVLTSWSAIQDYLRASMGFEAREQFRVLFLDKRNQLIADEVQQTGTVDHTPVYTREVVKRALELSASAIVLVHNHPSGDPTPSMTDIDMTRKIKDACEKLGIALHDHIIVGRQGHTSFRGLKLI